MDCENSSAAQWCLFPGEGHFVTFLLAPVFGNIAYGLVLFLTLSLGSDLFTQ